MKYLLVVRVDESLEKRLSEAEDAALQEGLAAWVKDLDARGVRLTGHRLQSPQEARIVRSRAGKTSVTDGPFAESKEQIAGYDILECASLREAVEAASRHPVATFGAIEVREFYPSEA